MGSMRRLFVSLVLLTACTAGDDPSSGVDAPASAGCPLPDSTGDAGTQSALKAQMCDVPMSHGMSHWYRLSATLDTGDIVQLELWPNLGAFSAGPVTTGTFPIETSPSTCGVCLRAIGDKGTATQKEYFGSGGMVNITALGADTQPISATITNATLVEINATSHVAIPSGCASSLAHIEVDGTVMYVHGTGGGGGGGGGAGTGACPTTVGD
jgi:hypothetical protein